MNRTNADCIPALRLNHPHPCLLPPAGEGVKPRSSRRPLDVPDVGCPPSASACDRSKRRRFGCRRTAELRELTCGGCLSEDPWVAASSTARRRLLRAQVAPKDSLREAFGDAGCRARFFPSLFVVQQKGRSPAGARPGQLRHAKNQQRQLEKQPIQLCAKRR